MPGGLGALRNAARSQVIAVKSGKSTANGLIVALGVVAAGVIFSLFTINHSMSPGPAPQQAQAPPQPAQDEQAATPPSQCWVTTDRERGYGYYRPC